jgi:hypothetical protein
VTILIERNTTVYCYLRYLYHSDSDVDLVEAAWASLAKIIRSSEGGAKAVLEAKVPDHLQRGLSSPIQTVRKSVDGIVHALAHRPSTVEAVCLSLVDLLRYVFIPPLCYYSDVHQSNRDVDHGQPAWHAVSGIATSPLPADALVKAYVLDLVPGALLSPNMRILSSTCDLVVSLVGHESPSVICTLPEVFVILFRCVVFIYRDTFI